MTENIKDIDDLIPDDKMDINGHRLVTVKQKTHLAVLAEDAGITLEAIVNLNPQIEGLEAKRGQKVRIS